MNANGKIKTVLNLLTPIPDGKDTRLSIVDGDIADSKSAFILLRHIKSMNAPHTVDFQPRYRTFLR